MLAATDGTGDGATVGGTLVAIEIGADVGTLTGAAAMSFSGFGSKTG
jgi:hypothetical protein